MIEVFLSRKGFDQMFCEYLFSFHAFLSMTLMNGDDNRMNDRIAAVKLRLMTQSTSNARNERYHRSKTLVSHTPQVSIFLVMATGIRTVSALSRD